MGRWDTDTEIFTELGKEKIMPKLQKVIMWKANVRESLGSLRQVISILAHILRPQSDHGIAPLVELWCQHATGGVGIDKHHALSALHSGVAFTYTNGSVQDRIHSSQIYNFFLVRHQVGFCSSEAKYIILKNARIHESSCHVNNINESPLTLPWDSPLHMAEMEGGSRWEIRVT